MSEFLEFSSVNRRETIERQLSDDSQSSSAFGHPPRIARVFPLPLSRRGLLGSSPSSFRHGLLRSSPSLFSLAGQVVATVIFCYSTLYYKSRVDRDFLVLGALPAEEAGR